MQTTNQTNIMSISELVQYKLKDTIVLQKSDKGKKWKLNEYYYSGGFSTKSRETRLGGELSERKLSPSDGLFPLEHFFDGYGELTYYNSDILRYSGNFTDGKKNGQGIEIYKNLDKYIGSFSKNERHGDGILYSREGNIKYSGKWKNNEPTSSMIYYTYDENNKKQYYGGFKNDLYHGLGIVFDTDGNITHLGEFNQGKMIKSLEFMKPIFQKNKYGLQIKRVNTKTTLNYLDTIYENLQEPYDIAKFEKNRGYLIDVNYSGNIFCFNDSGKMYYKGNVENNNFNDYGSYEFNEGNTSYILTGTFNNNKFMNGDIKYKNLNESVQQMYNGTYDANGIDVSTVPTLSIVLKKLLRGTYFYKINQDAYIYDGTFTNGFFNTGSISQKNSDGDWIIRYKGSFLTSLNDDVQGIDRYNKYNGNGIEYYYDLSNKKRYEGNYKNGKYNGVGTLYHPNENIEYTGSFNNGNKHGHGVLFDCNGILVIEGRFNNDNIQ